MLDGTEFFDCACSEIQHTMRFTVSLDDKVLYVDSCMDNCHTVWERIKYAWHHIRGNDSYDGGAFHEKILSYEDRERLRNMLAQVADVGAIQSNTCMLASEDNRLYFSIDSQCKDLPPMLVVNTYLARRSTWLECVWYGIAYVFGRKSRYGNWDCFEMNAETAGYLMYLLDVWSSKVEEFNKSQL